MHYNSKKKKTKKKKEIPTDRPNNFQLCNRKQTFFFFGLMRTGCPVYIIYVYAFIVWWFDFEVVLLCIKSVHKRLKGQDMSDISLVFNMIFSLPWRKSGELLS